MENMNIKIWVDDIRPAPEGYIWMQKTNLALRYIVQHWDEITEIALDHDAGVYQNCGGDYIKILNEIERLSRRGRQVNFVFSIHSQNAVGVANMRRIIERNHWKEVF